MTPSEFAQRTFSELNDEFEDREAYKEALEETIALLQSSLDAANEEEEK